MSHKPTCEICQNSFHYSETSELTVAMDIAGLNVPDICMWCEAEIQNARTDDDPSDAYAFAGGI